jgi:hypothetical protein
MAALCTGAATSTDPWLVVLDLRVNEYDPLGTENGLSVSGKLPLSQPSKSSSWPYHQPFLNSAEAQTSKAEKRPVQHTVSSHNILLCCTMIQTVLV